MTEHPAADRRQTAEAVPGTRTEDLVRWAQDGDAAAREELVRRYLPRLRGWAHGRLPGAARSLCDTDDLVQTTFRRAIENLEGFETRRPGAFAAFLFAIARNFVRDEVRKATHHGRSVPVSENLPGPDGSPVERLLGKETLERYERGLAKLREHQRLAVRLRLELGLSFQDLADELALPSDNAARMLVRRGLLKLAQEMKDDGGR